MMFPLSIRFRARPAPAALGCALCFLAVVTADATVWEEDWDGDGNPDHIFQDADDDGNPESCRLVNRNGETFDHWVDSDDDGIWDKRWLLFVNGTSRMFKEDTNGDGNFDTLWIDGGRLGPATPRNFRDGKVQQGELYAKDPVEPVPEGPVPQYEITFDCQDEPECAPPVTPDAPDIWFEDLLPEGAPDGIPDHWFSDEDDDTIPEFGARDENQDGDADEAYLDGDDDGIWDMRWWDANLDGEWDNFKEDSDGDGLFDLWWTDENLNQRVEAAEIIDLVPPEAPFLPPFPLGPLGFCTGGPECPDFDLFFLHPEDLDDHDRGNLRLTMTDQGTLGFLDATGEEGSGLRYPSDTSDTNHLFIGGLWVTQGDTEVRSRDYEADPAKSWVVSNDPDGHVKRNYAGNSDEDVEIAFDDDGEAEPFGFYIRQESWAFDEGTDDDDFVIVRYFIHNRSDEDRSDLRAGLFLDLDLEGTGTDDEGGTEPDQKMAYLVDPSGVHLGASLLDGDVSTTSNLTLIHNPTYVWPNQYILPADKLGFMRASDEAYELPLSPLPDDYSLLVAAGPFTLAPAESIEVTFAIVGGSDLPELRLNADRARATHNPSSSLDLPDSPDAHLIRLQLGPNPFRESTWISFQNPSEASVTLTVHDAQGRRLRQLADETHPAGSRRVLWDGRTDSGHRLGSGVYFVRLESGGIQSRQRLVIVR